MQAAFRRKMGRVYRGLLRGAIVTMARALAAVKAEPDIGPQEVQLMEVRTITPPCIAQCIAPCITQCIAPCIAQSTVRCQRSPWNLLCVQVALQQYHDHLGRFSAIFSEYEPPEYEQVQELYQLAREIELKKVTLTPTLTLTLTLPLPLTLTLTRSTSTSTARRSSSTSARC